MSVRKSSHGTIFLIVSSGSPRALIASILRSTSKKPFCPMTRSLHPPMTACGHRVRFVATWREKFFEVPLRDLSPSEPYYEKRQDAPHRRRLQRTTADRRADIVRSEIRGVSRVLGHEPGAVR